MKWPDGIGWNKYVTWHFGTLTTDAFKPGMNEFFSREFRDRFEKSKGDDTQYLGLWKLSLAIYKTERVSNAPCLVLKILAVDDLGKMSCDVYVPFALFPCLANDSCLVHAYLLGPVDLDDNMVTACQTVSYNSDSSSAYEPGSRV
jgi:hypothetical protein